MDGWVLLLLMTPCVAAIMLLAWAIARATGNIGWVDVVWTFGTGFAGIVFALVPAPGTAGVTTRQLIIALLVLIWSLRLGLYVAVRVAHGPEDARYISLREEWGEHLASRLFWFLELQGVCTLLLGLTILLAARNPAPGLRPLDGIAIAILVVAIGGEALADRQLARFKADPAHRGGICAVGLWRLSRHPNYFFEWLGWLAYPVMAIGLGYPQGWLAFIGPALMYAILVYGTGIPHLERHMLQSRGAAYRAYAARTNAFFPGPVRNAPNPGDDRDNG